MTAELWRISHPERAFYLVSEATLVIRAEEAARVSITLSTPQETETLLSSAKATRVGRIHGCLGLLNSGAT